MPQKDRLPSILDAANNQIFVSDIPDNIKAVADLIGSLDMKTAEVYIEARIVQVTLSDKLKLGVNWKAFSDKIDELGPVNVSADFNILSPDDQGLRYTSGLLGEKNYTGIPHAMWVLLMVQTGQIGNRINRVDR